MRRNLILLFCILVSVLLIVNGFKRIMSLKNTSKEVETAALRLENLKSENEALKRELEYKKSGEFVEGEIRNKLGLARENEAIIVVPKQDREQQVVSSGQQKPNWKKWQELFFGS